MELKLTPREETKLNTKRRAHYFSQGLVPAAVHGRSIDAGPCFVSVKKSKGWHRGSMFDVKWNGKPYKASIDELQKEPVSQKIIHVTFQLVGKNETTHIEIPIRLVGEAPGVLQEGGAVNTQLYHLTVEGKPDDIPEILEVDISSLNIGDNIKVGDIPLPSGCKWYQHEEDQTVAVCSHIKVQPVEEPTEDVSPEDTPIAGEEESPEASAEDGDETPEEAA